MSKTFIITKVKVVPYTFVHRGVPVREDTCAEPSACEVGWPVPFLAAFISPVFPLGTICCWVNSERAFSQGIESGSNLRPLAWEACTLTTMPPRSHIIIHHLTQTSHVAHATLHHLHASEFLSTYCSFLNTRISMKNFPPTHSPEFFGLC